MEKHEQIMDEEAAESNDVHAEEEIHAAENNQEEMEEDEAVSEPETSPLQELESKLEETTNRMLRLQADYDNFRRRTRLEREADAKYRSQRLVEELLPILDNFERAMLTPLDSEDGKSFMQGVEMIYRQFQDALAKEGVEPIKTVGEPFDPQVHQAVMQVKVEEYDSNIVVEELQKGYMLKDRVIRPAMVKVNE
ncbi:molecular chaperone GrpE [Evansella caseinilytica]|uniref:Protein GrpE n=1 Tax=Evansella caseinilytica TaxID=1503961 RepID=A0A1H3KGP5_9BACI|nr:nucleotide exchange factor GrpE [Evansella caseinilytica]SDY51317.1 molecular chaperone GrpE [Evansella caseinilytica]